MCKNSRCFFSDKACLAEIEMVCLEGKFSYKVQRKAEGTNKWKSPIPAAGHGATLRELSGTGPAVSHFSYQTGVNKPWECMGGRRMEIAHLTPVSGIAS